VSVVGGGNVAIDVARSALRLGAETVEILYRRSREEMPAFPQEIEEALREGVHIQFLVSPRKILGNGGKVTGVECIRMKLGEPDVSGRKSAIPLEGSSFTIHTDTMITRLARHPTWVSSKDIPSRAGLIQTDEMGFIHVRGYFAGGDAATLDRTVAVAIGSGKKAALAIHEYLQGSWSKKRFESIHVGGKGTISAKQYFHPRRRDQPSCDDVQGGQHRLL